VRAVGTEDVVAIQQLLALYGHVVDRGDLDLSEVFTEDAVFDASDSGGGRHEGLAAIRAFFALGKPPHPPSHHAMNVWAYEDGGETRALSKWMTIDRDTGRARSGDYADVLERTERGWRIRSRVVLVRFFVGAAPGRAA
jgi:hypothetical protein